MDVTLSDQIIIVAEGPVVQWRSDCLEAFKNPPQALKAPDVRIVFIAYLHHISENLHKKIAYQEIDMHKFNITIS